jgi:hypothetical protein
VDTLPQTVDAVPSLKARVVDGVEHTKEASVALGLTQTRDWLQQAYGENS